MTDVRSAQLHQAVQVVQRQGMDVPKGAKFKHFYRNQWYYSLVYYGWEAAPYYRGNYNLWVNNTFGSTVILNTWLRRRIHIGGGQFDPNPFDIQKLYCESGPWVKIVFSWDDYYAWSAYLEGFLPAICSMAFRHAATVATSSEMDELEARASESAWIKANQTSVEGAVFLVELGKTVRMMKSPLQGLTHYLKDAKKKAAKYWRALQKYNARMRKFNAKVLAIQRMPPGKKRDSLIRRLKEPKVPKLYGKTYRSKAEALSGVWLEYRYGWTPLLTELDNLAKGLAKESVVKKLPVQQFSGYAKTETTQNIVSMGKLYLWNGIELYGDIEAEVTSSVSAGIICGVDVTAYTKIWQYFFGFQPNKLFYVLWEVTWLSFVVDWFFNVSGFFRALAAKTDLYGIRTGWVTRQQSVLYTLRLREARYPNKALSQPLNYTYQWVERQQERKRAVPTVPGFPIWGAGLTKIIRQADSVALLISIFKGAFRR